VPSDGRYANKTWPDVEKDHAASITEVFDANLGKLLDHLKKEKLENNTIIIISSDNGAHNEGGHDVNFFNSSGPLKGFKRSLYEGGIRMPIIVY